MRTGEPGAGEGLAVDEVTGQAEFPAEGAGLVLEEQPQRLDDLLKIDVIGKSADIVVAFVVAASPAPDSITSG